MLSKKEVISIFCLLFAAIIFFLKISLPLSMAISFVPGWSTTSLDFDFNTIILHFGIAIVTMQLVILIGHKIPLIKEFFTANVISVGSIMSVIPFISMVPFWIQWYSDSIYESIAIYYQSTGRDESFLGLKLLIFSSIFLLLFRKIRNNYWANIGIVLLVILAFWY